MPFQKKNPLPKKKILKLRIILMIQIYSRVKVTDNSGARVISCIGVPGGVEENMLTLEIL
ncbi:MAG: hypothetical protein CM1200mP13_15300 [Candidatus Pelagibacterales bacterium]|nr:MAG: hypothetical protein CM1200mP13_15300 [Pelagibacterales bacterium]